MLLHHNAISQGKLADFYNNNTDTLKNKTILEEKSVKLLTIQKVKASIFDSKELIDLVRAAGDCHTGEMAVAALLSGAIVRSRVIREVDTVLQKLCGRFTNEGVFTMQLDG